MPSLAWSAFSKMEFNSALHTWSSIMHIRFARYVRQFSAAYIQYIMQPLSSDTPKGFNYLTYCATLPDHLLGADSWDVILFNFVMYFNNDTENWSGKMILHSWHNKAEYQNSCHFNLSFSSLLCTPQRDMQWACKQRDADSPALKMSEIWEIHMRGVWK